MRFNILGALEVTGPDGLIEVTSPTRRRLLGLLLVNQGMAVTTDRIVDILYGDEVPGDPAGSVALRVSKLDASDLMLARIELGAFLQLTSTSARS